MTRVQILLDPARTGREAAELETALRKRVIGQDEAVRQVVDVYQTYLAGLSSPGKPVASFLFLGPTGSGKTRMVEAVAESLVGDARAVIKVDCAEFQHSHEIAKLIGSPPGYLGHRETRPMLSQETLDERQTEKVRLNFVLFDEIEKSSDALWNLLLGILDKATLTLGDNRRVDFSHSMIFMTGNLGATEMQGILRPGLGFGAGEAERAAAVADSALEGKLSRAAMQAARRKFTAEFINRIDKTVVFRPLGGAELERILDIELAAVQQRIRESGATRFTFTLTKEAKAVLLREGTDMKYGARHLKRAIERLVVHALSNLIASEQVHLGDKLTVDYDREALRMQFYRTYRPVAEAEGELSVAA